MSFRRVVFRVLRTCQATGRSLSGAAEQHQGPGLTPYIRCHWPKKCHFEYGNQWSLVIKESQFWGTQFFQGWNITSKYQLKLVFSRDVSHLGFVQHHQNWWLLATHKLGGVDQTIFSTCSHWDDIHPHVHDKSGVDSSLKENQHNFWWSNRWLEFPLICYLDLPWCTLVLHPFLVVFVVWRRDVLRVSSEQTPGILCKEPVAKRWRRCRAIRASTIIIITIINVIIIITIIIMIVVIIGWILLIVL